MDGTTHQTVGVCSGIIVTALLFPTLSDAANLIDGGVLILGASLGSLMPDIDHPHSKMGRRRKRLSKIVSKTCGHRGWTHTLLALILILGGLFYIVYRLPVYQELIGCWSLGFGLGYLSHLILDTFTAQGTPLFKPFSSKNISLTKIKSNSIPLNNVTQFIFIVLSVATVYYQYFK